MSEIILSLLSGLFGAIIAVTITIFYTEYKEKKDKRLSLAREKLEKVYGPLIALKKRVDLVNQNEDGLLFPSNPQESEMIDKIIFHYYHLIDEDLREDIVLLHHMLRSRTDHQKKFPAMINKIRKHYNENKELLGLK